MNGTARGLLLLLLLVVHAGGCRDQVLRTYRDDPTLQAYATTSPVRLRQRLESPDADQRRFALRILAEEAYRAREAHQPAIARDRVREILEHFRNEEDGRIQNEIIALCLPVAGHGDPRVLHFLREQIADGRFIYAAIPVLALLDNRADASTLLPLAHHPDPELRYTVALGLCLYQDRRARAAATRILDSMGESHWPARINGMSLHQARNSLRQRIQSVTPPVQGLLK